jgi:hypothetical protein
MKKITSLASIQKKVTDQTSTLKEKATETSGKLGDFTELSVEKLKGALEEINSSLPVIEKVGYKANELEIELGLPPGISIRFEKFHDADDAEIEKILEENEDKKILITIIKALTKADELRAGMKLGKFIFSEVELELGITPKVKMKYLQGKENSDESGSNQTEDAADKKIRPAAPEKIDVNCGACQCVVGKVDRSKVPKQGLKVKCPKCQDPIILKP